MSECSQKAERTAFYEVNIVPEQMLAYFKI